MSTHHVCYNEKDLIFQVIEALNHLFLIDWLREYNREIDNGETQLQMIKNYIKEKNTITFTELEFDTAFCTVNDIIKNDFEQFREKYIVYEKENVESTTEKIDEGSNIPKEPDFSFIQDEHDRKMISRGYNKLFEIDGWDVLRNFKKEDNFKFSKDPKVIHIMKEIDSTYGHSGASLACLMRIFEYIAKEGFDKYREKYCK